MAKDSKTGKEVVQELDMAEHSARLRALPTTNWEVVKKGLVWLVGFILLSALGWLAIGR
jgi:hypothetical protein